VLFYGVEVVSPHGRWLVWRRYKHFRSLHAELSKAQVKNT